MKTIRELISLLDRRERIGIARLALILLIGSLIEILGIGLILPFMSVVSDPDILLGDGRLGWVFEGFGITTYVDAVLITGIALLGVFCFKGAYLLIQWRLLYKFIYSKMVGMSSRLLEAYLAKPYTFHLGRNTAELIQNCNREANNVAGSLQAFLVLLTEGFVLLGLLVLMFSTQPAVVLGGLMFVAIIICVGVLSLRNRLSRLGKDRVKYEVQMIQGVSQALGSVKEIKVLGKESYFIDTFQRAGGRLAMTLQKSSMLREYPRLGIEISVIVLLVATVTALVFRGSSLINELPALMLLGAALVRLVPSISRLVSAVNNLQFYTPSVGIVYEELKGERRPVGSQVEPGLDGMSSFTNQIYLKKVTYRYPDASGAAVSNLTLSINHGETVAIVGPTGAGKTTIVNLILGLLLPSSGKIMVDGRDIRESIVSWQRQIGYIPQDIYLLDDTIRRNVAFGVPDGEIDEANVYRALEAAQLSSFLRQLDKKLETVLGERGVRISGGERQRIGIARALYHDPRVLVLDEATSALDSETERQFADAIENLSKSQTLIVIAHRLSTVRHCNVIYLLDAGKGVGSGTYEELLSTNSMFQRLVRAADVPSSEPRRYTSII